MTFHYKMIPRKNIRMDILVKTLKRDLRNANTKQYSHLEMGI